MKRISLIAALLLFIGTSEMHAQRRMERTNANGQFLSLGGRDRVSEVNISHSYLLKKVKDVKAIQFSYSGDANFVKKFINLSKKLQKKYRGTYEIGFNYNMDSYNKPVRVLANYPIRTYKPVEHDLIYKIHAYDYEMARGAIFINETAVVFNCPDKATAISCEPI